MKKINLSWNGFGNEGAVALGKALAHNVMLEELDIRCNRIDPPGIASLFACFKDNNTLKKLNVFFFYFFLFYNQFYFLKKSWQGII